MSNYYGPPGQQQQQRFEQPQVFEHHKSSFRVPSSFNQQDFGPVSVQLQPSLSYSLPTQNLGQSYQTVNRNYQAPTSHVSSSYSAPSEVRGHGYVTQTNNFVPTDAAFGNQYQGNFVASNNGFSSNTRHSAPQATFVQPKTIVTKDIYVHAAPEDPEEFVTQHVQPQVNQKHYKILFIKAPEVNVQNQIRLQQQAQNEEKTIVYVLVKKPELNTEILQQAQKATPVSKPEVYFIKYKTQKERGQLHQGDSQTHSGHSDHGTHTAHVAHNDGQLGDTYSSALAGIEHAGGTYPEEKRTRKSNTSPYGPVNYRPGVPLG